MNKLVSIIVPVYNDADTLKECLASLQQQSYQNIEIIIVNDGSTDDSFAIMTQFADQDQRIRLLNQQHQGKGIARNHALEIFQGDFVTFVNADDFVNSNYVRGLVDQCEKYHSDIAVGDLFYFKNDPHQDAYYISVDGRKKVEGKYNSTQWLTDYGNFSFQIARPIRMACGKLISRHCLDNIRFTSNPHVDGDMQFMWKCYLNADLISFQAIPNYFSREHQLTPREEADERYGIVVALEEQISMLKVLGIDTSLYKYYYQQAVRNARDAAERVGDVGHYEQLTFKIDHFS